MNPSSILALILSATTVALSHAKKPSGPDPSKLPPGMFRTLGNQKVGKNGNLVRLSSVYWLGRNVGRTTKKRDSNRLPACTWICL